MKAQINKVNEGAVLVSLYNDERVVNQKWFDTERKANNFCIKYNYKIENMNIEICNAMQYEQ
jgi:hypothetical protein